jgi:hypothetical protein
MGFLAGGKCWAKFSDYNIQSAGLKENNPEEGKGDRSLRTLRTRILADQNAGNTSCCLRWGKIGFRVHASEVGFLARDDQIIRKQAESVEIVLIIS